MRSVILSTHICQQRYLLTSLYCCTVQDMQAVSRPSLSSHVTSVPCKPDLVASNMQFSFSGPWQAQLEDKHNSGQPGDNSSAVFPLYGRRMYLRQCWSQTASNPINLACACLFRQERKEAKACLCIHSQCGFAQPDRSSWLQDFIAIYIQQCHGIPETSVGRQLVPSLARSRFKRKHEKRDPRSLKSPDDCY